MPTGTPKYFIYPFGIDGTITTVPDTTQPSGVVSYQQGFGPDYTLPEDEAGSLDIPQGGFNQLLYDITSTLQQIYQNGFPLFITSAMNDGSPYAYAKNAYVYQPTNGNVYYSLIPNNTDVPPTANWQQINSTSVDLYLNYAPDTGTANAYVVAPSPAITSYVAGQVVVLNPVHANTGACTIAVSGLAAQSIMTLTNQNPASGALVPSGQYFLIYNGSNFVLVNPTLGTAAYVNTGSGSSQVPLNSNLGTAAYETVGATTGDVALLSQTLAINGYDNHGAITYQWGSSFGSTSSRAVTFPYTYSATAYNVQITFINQQGAQTTVTLPAVDGLSNTGFTMLNCSSPCYWFAVGPT